MVNEDIIKYLKSGLDSGMKIDDLKRNLIKEGWEERDVILAVSEINKKINIMPEIPKDISLPEKLESEQSPSLADEVNTRVQVNVEKKIIPPEVAIITEKKNFFSVKNIIIIGGSLIILIILSLIVFSGDSVESNVIIDATNGVSIEFLKSKIEVNFSGEIKEFKIMGVDEYIVRYMIDDFSGELYMRENMTIDLSKDGTFDTLVKLESIKEDIATIYVEAL